MTIPGPGSHLAGRAQQGGRTEGLLKARPANPGEAPGKGLRASHPAGMLPGMPPSHPAWRPPPPSPSPPPPHGPTPLRHPGGAQSPRPGRLTVKGPSLLPPSSSPGGGQQLPVPQKQGKEALKKTTNPEQEQPPARGWAAPVSRAGPGCGPPDKPGGGPARPAAALPPEPRGSTHLQGQAAMARSAAATCMRARPPHPPRRQTRLRLLPSPVVRPLRPAPPPPPRCLPSPQGGRLARSPPSRPARAPYRSHLPPLRSPARGPNAAPAAAAPFYSPPRAPPTAPASQPAQPPAPQRAGDRTPRLLASAAASRFPPRRRGVLPRDVCFPGWVRVPASPPPREGAGGGTGRRSGREVSFTPPPGPGVLLAR